MTHQKGAPQRLSEHSIFKWIFGLLIVIVIVATIVGLFQASDVHLPSLGSGSPGGLATTNVVSSDDIRLTFTKGIRLGEYYEIDLNTGACTRVAGGSSQHMGTMRTSENDNGKFLRYDGDPTVRFRIEASPKLGYTYQRIDGETLCVRPTDTKADAMFIRYMPFWIERGTQERKGQKAKIIPYR